MLGADVDNEPIVESDPNPISTGSISQRWRGFRVFLPLLLAACVLGALVAEGAAGEFGRRRKAIDAQNLNAAAGYPGAQTDGWPLPGPRPYWGQALGATHYNWGYFGARHDRAQFINHSGFYGEYTQFGYSRGY